MTKRPPYIEDRFNMYGIRSCEKSTRGGPSIYVFGGGELLAVEKSVGYEMSHMKSVLDAFFGTT
jgi:hypothetical protein